MTYDTFDGKFPNTDEILASTFDIPDEDRMVFEAIDRYYERHPEQKGYIKLYSGTAPFGLGYRSPLEQRTIMAAENSEMIPSYQEFLSRSMGTVDGPNSREEYITMAYRRLEYSAREVVRLWMKVLFGAMEKLGTVSVYFEHPSFLTPKYPNYTTMNDVEVYINHHLEGNKMVVSPEVGMMLDSNRCDPH